MTPPVALTIAGSDSSGGAGIQADLHAFARLGAYGASVLTAITAQNTRGVTDVHVLPTSNVVAQLDAVYDDLEVAAVKTGMLATAELVEVVAERAAGGRLRNLVVDPVLVSATGHRLLEEQAVVRYRQRLFPHALVVTPNLIEAGVLVGRDLETAVDVRDAARELAEDGPRVVVIKGGHAHGPQAVDLVRIGDAEYELATPRLETSNTHGTGCTFAAATAAGLATGLEPLAALERAKRYLTAGLARAAGWRIGGGCGPVDHGADPDDPSISVEVRALDGTRL